MKFLGRSVTFCWKALTVGRRFFANLLFLALIVVILAVLLADRQPRVPPAAVLVLDPAGAIVEQTAEPLLLDRFYGTVRREQTALNDLIDTIDYAADDSRIRVLLLQLDRLGPAGLSQLQEIGRALERFKSGGKKIIAAGESYDQHRYYLAAHADRVYLHPMGQVWIQGYGLYRHYIKNALEKLRVSVHVFRVGAYKSALEPLIRTDMSAEARQANRSWLNSLWEAYKNDIARLRGFDPQRIESLVNALDVRLAEADGDAAVLALNTELVDALKRPDEVRRELIDLVGEDPETHSFRQIGYDAYFESIRPEIRSRPSSDDRQVGVIAAQGIIMGGRQPAGRIGAESLAALIRQARENQNVKSLVLRIYSGGGSAVASEIIRRELALTREAGKPVVVSMSSVAASGGYWVATGGDEIWAEPTTITGSIGIFAALPTLDDTLAGVGINTDGVGTTSIAGAFDLTRPLNATVGAVLQLSIENGYRRFIEQVARARQMKVETVENIAQGRVWSGRAARERNLVDRLGGLQDAIQRAAELAGVQDDYQVRYIETPLSAREALLKALERWLGAVADRRAAWTPTGLIGDLAPEMQDLAVLLRSGEPGHPYAVCLDCEVR